MGVSIWPSSITCRAPVISPAPFSTATPAGTGSRQRVSGAPGAIAVTPVRATPRPAGGSGSSRTTVTWPTPTPATSVIEFAGPGWSRPMRMPCSRALPAWAMRGTLSARAQPVTGLGAACAGSTSTRTVARRVLIPEPVTVAVRVTRRGRFTPSALTRRR